MSVAIVIGFYAFFESTVLLILGRANGLISKNKTSEWFKDSFLDIIWSFPHQLNTNNFTNHMDYITDEAMNKIEEDIGKFLINQGLKPSMLFFDTTNFYTYIENGENIPQKGKSKEHRSDKNLIGLGLAVSEENIPLLHESYPGNSPDVKIFKMIFEKLVERLDALNVPTGDIVLVFDKGCNSKTNIDTVLSKMHIVGSIKKNQAEELFSVPLENYEPLYTNRKKHQIKGYRIKKTVFGTEFTVVASYNPGSFKKQSETYKKDKIIILEKLEEIKQSVERIGRGKKKDLRSRGRIAIMSARWLLKFTNFATSFKSAIIRDIAVCMLKLKLRKSSCEGACFNLISSAFSSIS